MAVESTISMRRSFRGTRIMLFSSGRGDLRLPPASGRSEGRPIEVRFRRGVSALCKPHCCASNRIRLPLPTGEGRGEGSLAVDCRHNKIEPNDLNEPADEIAQLVVIRLSEIDRR